MRKSGRGVNGFVRVGDVTMYHNILSMRVYLETWAVSKAGMVSKLFSTRSILNILQIPV